MRVRTFKECDATVSEESYITIGKWYDAKLDVEGGCLAFEIIDDVGVDLYCLAKVCGHLEGGDWEIED